MKLKDLLIKLIFVCVIFTNHSSANEKNVNHLLEQIASSSASFVWYSQHKDLKSYIEFNLKNTSIDAFEVFDMRKNSYILRANKKEESFYYMEANSRENVHVLEKSGYLEKDYMQYEKAIVYNDEVIGKIILYSLKNDFLKQLTHEELLWLQKHSTIRIHVEKNWIPFNYIDNGTPAGFTNDYMQLLANKIGVTLDYVMGYTWNEFMKMLKNKEIDVITNMVKLKEREEFALFTENSIYEATSSIYSNKKDNGYQSLKELKGLTVAITKGFWEIPLLKKDYPGIKIYETKESLESIQLLSKGQVDALIDKSAVVNALMLRHDIVNVHFNAIADFKNLEEYNLRMGVRKDWKIFRSILDKAIVSVTLHEKATLKNRWFLSNESATYSMYLSNEEKEYLKNKKVIKMCLLPSFMPYEGLDRGQHTGVTKDLIDNAQKMLNVTFEVFPTKSINESLKALSAGKCDFMPLLKELDNRKTYLNFTKPYLTIETGIITGNNELYVDDLKQVFHKRIGVVNGSSYYNFIKENYPEIELVTFDTIEEGFDAIRKKEIYGYIDTLGVIGYHIQHSDDFSLKVAGKLDIPVQMSIGTRNTEPVLDSIFEKIVASIKREDIAKAYSKWINIKFEEKIDYTLAYQVLAASVIIIFFILFWLKKLRDEIEKRKIIEQKLEQSNNELQTLVHDLKETQDKLIESEKMASLGSLVAGIAHEINTPVGIGLTGITHFTEVLTKLSKDYKNNEMCEEGFETFLTTAQELSRLIETNLEKTAHLIRSFKQIAVDQSHDMKREIIVKEYIDEVLFSVSSIIKKTKLTTKIVCDDHLKLDTFPGAISQIVTNLVINSVRHGFGADDEGMITISISKEDDKVTLRYQDNGRGIKKENLCKIFDPFFTTNREEGGTGLGLNVVYNIVTNILGGQIEYHSEENKGVEFIITFQTE